MRAGSSSPERGPPGRQRRVPRAERRHAALQPRADRDPAASRRPAAARSRGRGRRVLHPRRRADVRRRGRGGRRRPGHVRARPAWASSTRSRIAATRSCGWSTSTPRPASTSGWKRTEAPRRLEKVVLEEGRRNRPRCRSAGVERDLRSSDGNVGNMKPLRLRSWRSRPRRLSPRGSERDRGRS